ncbi:MAG: hypothetical protein PUK59_07035 [Actinomycetaceae bacterium]|nr:hypothetical protein [Actinomycetaceae bacterium]MDY5854958.1 hypothetical protein [Arcanobacterium sp.]
MTPTTVPGLPSDGSGDAKRAVGAAPGHVHRIRSFSLRGARLGDKYEQLMAEHAATYVIDVPPGEGVSTISPTARIDVAREFGREAPLIVEIGPGSGEQLVASAVAHPERNYLGVEAWPAGVARCVKNALAAGVQNVRLMQLDAAQGLPVLFPPNTADVDADGCAQRRNGNNVSNGNDVALGKTKHDPRAAQVWTFFPDPWRKRKHRKRRLISPEFAYAVAAALVQGGMWRLATDWPNYAWQMRDVLMESPWFDLVPPAFPQRTLADSDFWQGAGHLTAPATSAPAGAENPAVGADAESLEIVNAQLSTDDAPADLGLYRGGFAPRWEERVTTRFEERGIEAGRHVYDIVAVRNSVPLAAFPIPEDPWIAAAKRGEQVLADQPGLTPPPSSRSGWLRQQSGL